MKKIYLDNSATTRISEKALEKYIEVSRMHFGNPSSLHALGVVAEGLLKEARKSVARALGASDGEILFTASGSEANNLAIFGRAYAKERYRRGAKIITSAGEHSSVREPLKKLAEEGYKVVEIPTRGGVIDLEVLEAELKCGECILVTMMLVNNETGALYNLGAVSAMMKKYCKDAVLHVDATQAFMKVPFSPKSLGADLITVSSHKVEGPKGVGALYVSDFIKRTKGLSPLLYGGGQESGLRPGTENVPGICAFGEAVNRTRAEIGQGVRTLTALREELIGMLREQAPEVALTLPPNAAPHILNITLPSIKSETMLHYLSREGIYISSGSACSSNGAHRASAALLAYGHSEKEADASLRISLCEHNTKEELCAFVSALRTGLSSLARFER